MLPEQFVGREVGNYVIRECIGEGGMGQVFRAEHPCIQRQVAVKILDSQLARQSRAGERFEAEARALTRIRHPNIIEVYDYGTLDDGNLYYVMELLDGQNLRELLERSGGMTARQAWPYVEQICAAVQGAHDRGVIHRDIKPENIYLLRGEGVRVKILDFGIAKLLQSNAGVSRTETGMVMGSPLCIAPEQAAGKPGLIGPWTDIYSLGVLLYWMLGGRPPFWDDSPGMLIANHIKEPAPPLTRQAPRVPEPVARLIHRCLEKDHTRRPPTAAGLSEAYLEALDATPAPLPTQLTGAGERPDGGAADHDTWPDAWPPNPGSDTTMNRATGELDPELFSSTSGIKFIFRIYRYLGVALGLAVVLFCGAMAAVLLIRSEEAPAPAAEAARQAAADATRTPATAPLAAPAAVTAPAEAPVAERVPDAARPRVHTVEVTTEGARARCAASLDGGKVHTGETPCRFLVGHRQHLRLTVRRAGFRPWVKQWTVTSDRAIVVQMTRMRSSTTRRRPPAPAPATRPAPAPAPKKQLGEDIVGF